MKKSYIKYSLCLFVFFCYVFNSFAKSDKKEFVTAYSAIVVDLKKNKIIYAKNIYSRLAPASTQKVLTALVVLEKLGLNKDVEISRNASVVEPTQIGLDEDETYNSLGLINAVLISSANDASVALAEAAAGSESEFAKMMNKKARSLGARRSNFVNASGLSAKNQYTTAYDLYRIIKAALNNPVIYQIMKKKRESIKNSKGNEITLFNHNKMLFKMRYPLVLGKTGYTRVAKHCYAGIAYFGDKKYAIVILKSRKPWLDIKNLLNLIKKILTRNSVRN